MYGIYLIFTVLFLWFSVAGGTLVVHRWCPSLALARSLAIMVFVLAAFFIEHFIGLGRLHVLLPVVLAGAGWVFWKRVDVVGSRAFLVSECIFVAAFFYAFLWRFSFPSITPSSERMTDLFFITNYLQGVTLPPVDNWNPPHRFDYYYAFQHYGAALFGRIFNLGPGETYNFSFALLAALPLTLVAAMGQQVFAALKWKPWQRVSVSVMFVAAIAFGGNGFTPLLMMTYKGPELATYTQGANSEASLARATKRYHDAVANRSRDNIIGAARYIGSDRDKSLEGSTKVNRFFASTFFPDTAGGVGGKKMVLPSENLGYQYFLGDYHPTVGGFFLLTVALAVVFSLSLATNGTVLQADPRVPWEKLGQAALTLCVPLMMITNTWTLPLLVLLIVGWMLYQWLNRLPIHWLWLTGGGVAGSLLIYPFMAGFLTSTLSTPVAWVPSEMHTPWARFLALQWPVLLFILLGFWEGRFRRVAWMFSGVWLFLLILSEVIYIDDPTAAHFSRTNTVMKWWGWIQVGVFASLGAMLISSSVKWLRWVTIAVLSIITLTAGVELWRYWLYSGKHYAGFMEGHRWHTHNATNRQMFEYLEAAADGVVLERVLDNAYSNTSIYGIFTGKPVLLGWPSHLRTWHGDVPRIWILKDEIDQFYKGEMKNPVVWLESQNVRYIVFSPKDDNTAFDKIDQQINRAYAWHEFEHSRKRHTGIWVKINNN